MKFQSVPLEQRFWLMVDKNGPIPERRPELGPCWIWNGHRSAAGYGRVAVTHRQGRYAHAVSYAFVHGAIPEGLEHDHLCSVPSCVNPAHLEAVPHRVNLMRSNSLCAVNARKTHCKRGHEFTPENTYRTKAGRACRTCETAKSQRLRLKWNPGSRGAPGLRTHCPWGHEYSTENTYLYKGIQRCCRKCKTKAGCELRRRAPQAASAQA